MRKRLTFVLAIALTALLLPQAVSFLQKGRAASPQPLALQRPAFVYAVYADENSPSGIGEKLDQEAGIAAYYKTPGTINLNDVRGQFRTIEDETSSYIIGSVPYPDNPEKFDVHVYVHKDGWILAYYVKTDPASKIVDVKNHTLETTKLRSTISTIAGVAGAPFTGVTYYDFRFPNATHMMLVGEDYKDGSDFTIQLPTEFGYFERSWIVYDYNQNKPTFIVDGIDQHDNGVFAGDGLYYGTLSASQLLPNVPHTISIEDYAGYNAYGALALIYSSYE